MKTKIVSNKKQNLLLLTISILVAFLTVRFEVWHQQQYIITDGNYDYFYLIPIPILIGGIVKSVGVFKADNKFWKLIPVASIIILLLAFAYVMLLFQFSSGTF
jgi:hypothetical protein